MSTEAARTEGKPEPQGLMKIIDWVLAGPLAGILPWIAMSLLAGPNRFELAVGVALALALAGVIYDLAKGHSLKMFGLCDVVFFIALGIVGLLISEETKQDIEKWSGEISNVAVMSIALFSVVIRQPFTIQYAKDETPKEYWDSPTFIHINYVLTWAWIAAFAVAAISGAIGDAVIDDSNNLWTGWVIQIGAILVAVQFTQWYPEVGSAKAAQKEGRPTDPPPPLSALLIPLAGYLTPVGIIALIADAAPTWVGIAFIVAGVGLTHLLVQNTKSVEGAERAQEERAGF
jgi:hypothetical protein